MQGCDSHPHTAHVTLNCRVHLRNKVLGTRQEARGEVLNSHSYCQWLPCNVAQDCQHCKKGLQCESGLTVPPKEAKFAAHCGAWGCGGGPLWRWLLAYGSLGQKDWVLTLKEKDEKTHIHTHFLCLVTWCPVSPWDSAIRKITTTCGPSATHKPKETSFLYKVSTPQVF